MRLLRLTLLGALALLLGFGTAAAGAAERAIIILDGSGSMWAQIDGEARISIAKETLSEVLDAVPPDLELGFMSYGHREEGDCADIELMVEPAAGTADAIREAAGEITPLGKTPLSDAVRMAAEDLSYLEEKATVILITDGIESCEADPCALATDLEQRGIDFTTHVVGFGLTEEEGEQVACLAENTGGKYFSAGDGPALAAALETTVTEVAEAEEEPAVVEEEPEEPAALEYNLDPIAVLTEGGNPLNVDYPLTWELSKANPDGTAGEYVRTDYGATWVASLEPGDYVLRASLGFTHAEQQVTITSDDVAQPMFVMNAGRLIIRPLPSEGADPEDSAAVYTAFPGGEDTTNYGVTNIFVPAGDIAVEVSIGNGKASETVTVAAGEEVTRDIVVGVGHAVLNAFYVEGMKVEDSGLSVNIRGKKDIAGNAPDFGTSYGPDTGFDLPPGDYTAVLTMQSAMVEIPFTVTTGERIDVVGVLDAGVIAIEAPGTDFVEVLSAKADIQGNRKSFGYGYGGALQLTLPAGEYIVTADVPGGEKKQSPASVVAGERTELRIE